MDPVLLFHNIGSRSVFCMESFAWSFLVSRIRIRILLISNRISNAVGKSDEASLVKKYLRDSNRIIHTYYFMHEFCHC